MQVSSADNNTDAVNRLPLGWCSGGFVAPTLANHSIQTSWRDLAEGKWLLALASRAIVKDQSCRERLRLILGRHDLPVGSPHFDTVTRQNLCVIPVQSGREKLGCSRNYMDLQHELTSYYIPKINDLESS